MEFTAKKDELLRELSLIQGIVERKNTIPILANVLIEASEDRVQLAATDLDVSLRCSVGATVVKPGALTLSAKKYLRSSAPYLDRHPGQGAGQ